jgi:hypothetical protein
MSVRLSLPVLPSAWNNSFPTGGIFIKFDILSFFRKSVEKIPVSVTFDEIKGTVDEDLCTFVVVSRSALLGMRNFSDSICRENQNTYLCSILFCFENCVLYEIMWKNSGEPDKPQLTI